MSSVEKDSIDLAFEALDEAESKAASAVEKAKAWKMQYEILKNGLRSDSDWARVEVA